MASLGYFVDIYDLILFNIIKKDSLSSLNIDVNMYETVLFRWQMAGMLIGGLIWGILGDIKGRVSVLLAQYYYTVLLTLPMHLSRLWKPINSGGYWQGLAWRENWGCNYIGE